jgi:hypothetical protein
MDLHHMKHALCIATLLMFTVSAVGAADLRGKLSGLSGATITAKCGGVSKSAKISKNGSFNVGGLPINQSCSFTLSIGQSSSVGIPFNTKNNVTEYRGSARVVGKKIIVARI